MEYTDISEVIEKTLHLCGELNGVQVGGQAVPARDTPTILKILGLFHEKLKKIEDLELELGVQKLAIKTLKTQLRNWMKSSAV